MARVVIKNSAPHSAKSTTMSWRLSAVFPQLTDYRQWIALAIVLLPMLMIWVLDLNQRMSYQRALVDEGSYPLLISGNFAHLGTAHWFLNACAWLLIWLYARSTVSLFLWITATLLLSTTIGLGLYTFDPHVDWYVGLSGVLHGLMLITVYQLHQNHFNDIGVYLVGFGLFIKIIGEHLNGPSPGTAQLAGGPVVIEAHLYGIIGGLMIVSCIFFTSLLVNVFTYYKHRLL